VSLAPAVALEDSHILDSFDCGVPELDNWLRGRARANQVSGASRTFVSCEGSKVVGYYALASSALAVAIAPGKFRRNMPDPIPVIVLGRLAVDRAHAGKGLGRSLFFDAGRRVLDAADIVGVRGMLVHAISARAKAFYVGLGLVESPTEPMTLTVTLAELRAAMEQA
jgi:GNAT superfamily N-acetyltransferase